MCTNCKNRRVFLDWIYFMPRRRGDSAERDLLSTAGVRRETSGRPRFRFSLAQCTWAIYVRFTGTYHNVTSKDTGDLKITLDTTHRRSIARVRDAWLACTRQVTSLKHRPPDWSTRLSPVGPNSRASQAPLKRWETRRSISWKRDCGKSGSSARIIYKYHVVEGERERIGGVHRHANSQPVKFYDTGHWPVRYQVQQTEKRFARA